MRYLVARLYPPMCGEKIRLVMSTKHMDTYDPDTGVITRGQEYKVWQTCGKRPGHSGEHGGGRRLDRLRLRVANWIEGE